MNTDRRGFLGALLAMPLVGRVAGVPYPGEVVLPKGTTITGDVRFDGRHYVATSNGLWMNDGKQWSRVDRHPIRSLKSYDTKGRGLRLQAMYSEPPYQGLLIAEDAYKYCQP